MARGVVVELPLGLMAGMILDSWQRVLADLGAVGPDKGRPRHLTLMENHHQ